jgi:long-chain acyl-CoA synthetase
LLKQSAIKSKQPDYPYARWAQRWPVTWIRTLVYHLVTLPYIMIMARPRILGREKLLDCKGPALVVCNHISQVDIGYVMAALPFHLRRRLAAAMQGEMLRDMRHPPKEWPFLRRWLKQLNYVLISALFNVFSLPQKAKYRESFRFAGELADQGYNVLIFPEGRRTETGEMSPFRSGIGLLATHLNLPVIPMRIDGMFPLKAAKKHYARPGTIQVRIGDPVRFDANANAEEIATELRKRVAKL